MHTLNSASEPCSNTASARLALCTSDRVFRETCRYLGYGKAEPTEAEQMQIRSCLSELGPIITPRCLWEEFPLAFPEEGELLIGSSAIPADHQLKTTDAICTIKSRNLSKNLTGCRAVLFFAATLGSGVDMLLHRYSKLEVSRAAMLQSASAAVLEEYCDRQNRLLKAQYEAQGQYLRPRFSPGYGDFPLEFQKDFFRILNCQKQIGLSLTDSLLIAPSKSVTALIGVSETAAPCHLEGCEACGKTDCTYRRN